MSGLPAVEVHILDRRLPGWGFPHWGSALAAGLDLHACLDEPVTLSPDEPPTLIRSGFAVRIGAAGWCGLIAPRSGLGHRGLVLGNTIGVLDADYEGEVMISAWNRNSLADGPSGAITIAPGDRIAQLLFVPVARPRLSIVDRFSAESARGQGGFGSSGVGPRPGPQGA